MVDRPDLNSAREEAIDSARELMSARVRKSYAPDKSSFEIANEEGDIVMAPPFGEALRAG